jgi:hypothetical protein
LDLIMCCLNVIRPWQRQPPRVEKIERFPPGLIFMLEPERAGSNG